MAPTRRFVFLGTLVVVAGPVALIGLAAIGSSIVSATVAFMCGTVCFIQGRQLG